jgi:hypothetical protein
MTSPLRALGKSSLSVWLFVVLCSTVAFAGKKIEVEILDSDVTSNSYNVPARAICLPGTQGPTCGYRGAQAYTVGFVKLQATINGAKATLTCDSAHEKQCSRFNPGKYPAEAKGKDEIILYGWHNPIYRGDLKKATKVKFRVGAATE